MNLETIEAFNSFAEQYVDSTFSNILQYELNRFIAFLPKNAKILDLACGSGRDVQYFLDYNLNPIGIDASKKMIEEAKKKVPNGEFKVMNIESMKFKKDTFDGIWALDAISYVEKKEVNKVVKTLNNILKESGIVFVSVRKGEDEKIIEYEKLGKSQIKVSFFSQEELESLFIRSSFTILNSFTQEGQDFAWINIYARKDTSQNKESSQQLSDQD